MKSEFLKLNAKDLFKSIIMVFISALLTGFYQLLQQSSAWDWETFRPILMSAVAAVIAYLLKNFFTNSKDEFMSSEKPSTISSSTTNP